VLTVPVRRPTEFSMRSSRASREAEAEAEPAPAS